MGNAPQCLVGVHCAAVRLQVDNLAPWAGNRRAQGDRQSAADCATADGVQVVVRSRTGGLRKEIQARGRTLINQDGVFRHQQTDALADRSRG